MKHIVSPELKKTQKQELMITCWSLTDILQTNPGTLSPAEEETS